MSIRILTQASLLEDDAPSLPADGRQSERALAIRRGVSGGSAPRAWR